MNTNDLKTLVASLSSLADLVAKVSKVSVFTYEDLKDITPSTPNCNSCGTREVCPASDAGEFSEDDVRSGSPNTGDNIQDIDFNDYKNTDLDQVLDRDDIFYLDGVLYQGKVRIKEFLYDAADTTVGTLMDRWNPDTKIIKVKPISNSNKVYSLTVKDIFVAGKLKEIV